MKNKEEIIKELKRMEEIVNNEEHFEPEGYEVGMDNGYYNALLWILEKENHIVIKSK